jgi:hypothetical protein
VEKSALADQLFRSLAATEPGPATESLDGLIDQLRSESKDGLDLQSLRLAYLRLLRRRGYFVETPDALARSLSEIATVGPGFDLFDLSRNVAVYETLRTDCLHLDRIRALPELRRFCSHCACGKHRKED